jgi:tRNA(adenine34) deaminase
LLQDFFQARRNAQEEQRRAQHPLRDDALRTPEHCFADLPGYPWAPNYVSTLPTLAGLRMHYLDEGPPEAPTTYLCLHGNPTWSYLYRKMIPVFAEAGHRVIAPDLIGFGKSDKPKKDSAHQFVWHRQVLLEFIEALDLRSVVLVVQDWGGLLGLTVPMEAAQRYTGLVVMNTVLSTGEAPLSAGFTAWATMCANNPAFDIARLMARSNRHLNAAECAAYMAPFPDSGHRAATRAFPTMVAQQPDTPAAAIARQARTFWQTQWTGRSLMAIGMQDPVFGIDVMESLHQDLRGCPPALRLAHAGHFVQEHGEAVAREAVRHFGASSRGKSLAG